MSNPPDPSAAAATGASKELDRLNDEISAARAVLVRLLQDAVEAESRARQPPAAQLVQANEQLVLAALRAQAEAEMATLALNDVSRSAELDTLTQLPNRVLLLDRLAQAITLAQRRGARLALLFLDLDNFKQINDTLGHAVGDEVLKLVAGRLASTVRAADSVGRHGGDEFLILLTEVATLADAASIADKLLSALSAPSLVGQHVLRLAASIGIALYPDDGIDTQTLIASADDAMYHAKRHSLGRATCADKAAWDAPASARPLRTWNTAPVTPLAVAQVDHEVRHAQLREANEKLVLAALDAQQLQAAAEQALRRQSAFMATVADELKNPLAPIRLATAMLGRIRTEEPLLPRAQEIFDKQVAQITRIVNTLHEVSSASAGAVLVQKAPVELGAIVAAAIAACRPAMDLRLQVLELRLPLRPVELQGDFDRLVQAVSNLLDNATKYTPQGGRIELSAEQVGSEAVLTVADNGIGISPAALTTIFEPFVQDIRAAGYNGVGPGLGLTVVRAVVAAHGGTVTASSGGPGRGSRFVISLPLGGPAQLAP
jgi:diguanylate cyclase